MAAGHFFMLAARTRFGKATISISTKSKARIFHLGYLLLLDALDQPDANSAPRPARLLRKPRPQE